MHALDELLILYRGRDPAARRYFLSSMADLRPSFDTDVLVDFLWHEVASPDAAVGRAARRELGRVLPGALKHAHALTRSARSVWSDYFGREQLERYLTDQALASASEGEIAPLEAAGVRALEPALARAAKLLGSADPRRRTVSSLVLGQWKSAAAVAALAARLEQEPGALEAAAALAEHGTDEATQALLEHARAHWRDQPDLLALLAAVRSPRVLPVLERIVPATNADGRACIALALGANTVPGARDLLRLLTAWNEGWTVAGALKSMTAHPDGADLSVVQEVANRERHEFLKAQAVRTAGWLPGAQSFLAAALSLPQPRVQAAALEGLARQRMAPAELAQAARRLLDSPLLKTRVNAVLALARPAPEECAGGIQALLLAEAAGERLEGAYVLGYVAGGESASALATVLSADPDPAVRLQALKSLARQPARTALDRLLAVYAAGDPALAPLAAQAIGDLDGLDAALVEERLGAAIRESAGRPGRPVALRALARAAARTMASVPPDALVRHLADDDPAMMRAAISGLRLLGDRAPIGGMGLLVRHDDPRVRAGAAAAAFLAGELAAAEVLGELLSSEDDASAKAGLNTLLELVVLLPAALRSARFLGLRQALGAGTQAPPESAPAPAASGSTEKPTQSWEPAPSPAALAGTVRTLEQRYTRRVAGLGSSPAVPRPARPVDRATVEALSYLAGMPLDAGRAARFFRTYGMLVAAPLVLIATLTFALQRPGAATVATGPGGAAVAPAGTFTVRKVRGAVTLRPGAAVKLRDFVAPGSTIATGPNAEVEMTDADGSQVWLGPGSSIEVAAPPAVLRAPAGDVLITFRERPALDVATAAGVLKLERAMVRVSSAGQALTARVLSGRASWVARGEPPVTGDAGAVLEIKN